MIKMWRNTKFHRGEYRESKRDTLPSSFVVRRGFHKFLDMFVAVTRQKIWPDIDKFAVAWKGQGFSIVGHSHDPRHSTSRVLRLEYRITTNPRRAWRIVESLAQSVATSSVVSLFQRFPKLGEKFQNAWSISAYNAISNSSCVETRYYLYRASPKQQRSDIFSFVSR